MELIATIVTITVGIYAFIFGGKGLLEYYLERKKQINLSNVVDSANRASETKICIINNLRRSECIGRRELIKEVITSVKSSNPLTIISGNRGSGKTTIALAAAHKLFEESKTAVSPQYEAFIWVDARYKYLSLDAYFL